MAKVIFTDDTFTILAAIPITSSWTCRQNLFVSAKASEVLAGKGGRLCRVNQACGDTKLMPAPILPKTPRIEA